MGDKIKKKKNANETGKKCFYIDIVFGNILSAKVVLGKTLLFARTDFVFEKSSNQGSTRKKNRQR